MTPYEPNEDIGELLDTRPEEGEFSRAKGEIAGAINRAFSDFETEENSGQFQQAIDEQWEAVYIRGSGDVNENGSLTLASVAKAEDFVSIVFENGWVLHDRKWIHDDQLVHYVSNKQDKADQQAKKAAEKEQEAIEDWSGIKPHEYAGTEIEGWYTFEKTGFVGSASQVVAHAAGYNRAVKEILQTEEY